MGGRDLRQSFSTRRIDAYRFTRARLPGRCGWGCRDSARLRWTGARMASRRRSSPHRRHPSPVPLRASRACAVPPGGHLSSPAPQPGPGAADGRRGQQPIDVDDVTGKGHRRMRQPDHHVARRVAAPRWRNSNMLPPSSRRAPGSSSRRNSDTCGASTGCSPAARRTHGLGREPSGVDCNLREACVTTCRLDDPGRHRHSHIPITMAGPVPGVRQPASTLCGRRAPNGSKR